MKSTKKSLVLSALSLMMCVAMLLGTTYAWFTDSVTSGKNIITAGNLDIEMYYADGTKDPASVAWADASDATIFNYDLWEPGYTDVKHIKIANVGTLALKYQLAIVADGDLGILADVLDVYVTDTATKIAERSDLSSMTKIGTLSQVLANASLDLTGNLMPAGTEGKTSENTLTIAVKMQETAGNEYQGKSIANGFTVVVKATQYTYENDSFDNQYDKDATYPEVFVPTTYKASTTTEIKTVLTEAKDGDVVELPEAKGENKIKLPAEIASTDVVIKGAGSDKTEIDRTGAQGLSNANLSIQDVTLVGGTADYQGFQHTDTEYYENCKFTGKTFFYGNEVVCKNCVFEQTTYDYCFWTYGAKNITFENCTFNTVGKAAKVYNESTDGEFNVTFTNCVFNTTNTEKDKPAIAVNSIGAKFNIVCNGCTAVDFANGTSVEDNAMNTWYTGRMASAPATARQLIGCEGQLDKITVTVDGVSY